MWVNIAPGSPRFRVGCRAMPIISRTPRTKINARASSHTPNAEDDLRTSLTSHLAYRELIRAHIARPRLFLSNILRPRGRDTSLHKKARRIACTKQHDIRSRAAAIFLYFERRSRRSRFLDFARASRRANEKLVSAALPGCFDSYFHERIMR